MRVCPQLLHILPKFTFSKTWGYCEGFHCRGSLSFFSTCNSNWVCIMCIKDRNGEVVCVSVCVLMNYASVTSCIPPWAAESWKQPSLMASLGASLSESHLDEQLAQGPDHMAPTRKQPRLKIRAELSTRLGVFCGAGASKSKRRARLSADEQSGDKRPRCSRWWDISQLLLFSSRSSVLHLNAWGQSSSCGSQITGLAFVSGGCSPGPHIRSHTNNSHPARLVVSRPTAKADPVATQSIVIYSHSAYISAENKTY